MESVERAVITKSHLTATALRSKAVAEAEIFVTPEECRAARPHLGDVASLSIGGKARAVKENPEQALDGRKLALGELFYRKEMLSARLAPKPLPNGSRRTMFELEPVSCTMNKAMRDMLQSENSAAHENLQLIKKQIAYLQRPSFGQRIQSRYMPMLIARMKHLYEMLAKNYPERVALE